MEAITPARSIAAALGLALAGCAGTSTAPASPAGTGGAKAMVAQLESAALTGSAPSLDGLGPLVQAFQASNPGYQLEWAERLGLRHGSNVTEVIFVQDGECQASVLAPGETEPSDSDSASLRVGDIAVLRPGETLRCEPAVAAVVFHIPTPPPASVPTFIRPDFDPAITDTPGGCAEEEEAYRRILLTWQGKVGPYLYHAINAHRVRILDSFTHYHPANGGFDEFYLVQDAPEGAELIVSEHLDAILGIAAVTRDDIQDLLRRIPLHKGQLIYLPRTVVHRGIGGAVVQVITVPGFVPGAEIGVDDDLTALNERLELSGSAQLPVHVSAAKPAR